jgi:protocatechuate 3,4-dioxygenase beta subunit
MVLGPKRRAVVFVGIAVLALAIGFVVALRRGEGGQGGTTSPAKVASRGKAAALARATLRGTVKDAAGAPLEGARIEVVRSDEPSTKPLASATTDAAGAFSVDLVAAPPFDVTARKGGFAAVTMQSLGTPEPPLAFNLEPAAVLRGVLKPPAGATLTNARVTIIGSGVWPERQTAADAAGAYVFDDIPAGVYAVRAAATGLVSATREGLLLEAGEEATADLTLEPAASVTGVVLGDKGDPVDGARVWVREGGLSMFASGARTDKKGQFTIEGLHAGPVRVFAEARGFVPGAPTELVAPTKTARVVLARTGSASGRVVGENGKGLAARIEVFGTTEANLPLHLVGPAPDTDAGAKGDAAGDALRALIPAGHLGMTVGQVPPISAAGNGRDTPITADVFASAADGSFTLNDLPPGSYRLLVLHPKFALTTTESFRVLGGAAADAGTVTLGAGGRLSVVVRDEEGAGLPDLPVALRVEGLPYLAESRTDADGRAGFDGVLGVVEVNVDPPGKPTLTAGLSVLRGETTEHVFTVPMGRGGAKTETTKVIGRVIDGWSQKPVTKAKVTLGALTTTTGRDGTFSFAAVPVGDAGVRVTAAMFAALGETRTIAASRYGDAFDVGDLELDPGAKVSGTVVDALGHTVEGATVELAGDAAVRTKTGARGTFVLDGVPAGLHHLTARHTTAGEATEGPVRVAPGDALTGERILLPGRAD